MFTQVNNTNIWYEKFGSGEPIILLHGNCESNKIFRALIDQLSDHFTVYAIDSRCHGKSDKTPEISYDLIAADVIAFIYKKRIRRPILCGFNDGGIVGLVLASKHPHALSKLIVCSANSNPDGIKRMWRNLFRLCYFFSRNAKIKMMLIEPNITKTDLEKIKIPVMVLAAEKDLIREEDSAFIADSIPNSFFNILTNETHTSYVVNSPKLYNFIMPFAANAKYYAN